MEAYKRGSHTVWDCKYHLVWVTKYRYPVLGGDVGLRCRELLRETATAHEMVIHAGAVNRDHVHLLGSIPPSLSVSRAVQYLKGRSSHKLLSEFGILRKRYWGQHLWGRGYWVATSGKVTGEVGPCGRPNPAFSRNPKPPPSGGGKFTKVRDPSPRRAPPHGWPPSPAKRLFVPFRVQDDFAEIDAFVFRVP